MKKYMQLIDLKLSAMLSFYAMVSFSDAEIAMKIFVFILTAGYTIHRWYLLIKNKNE